MQSNVSKSKLRHELLDLRLNLHNKQEKSNQIFQRLNEINELQEATTVLLYASAKGEVDTFEALPSLLQSKKVAMPYCVDNNGNMEFYYINCIDDFVKGKFGILEPDITKCQRVLDFSNSVIIVPAIAFDEKCFRLGYGGGYYDRFLEKYDLFSIGLCYNDLVQKSLPVEKHDKSVNAVVTETAIFKNN